MTITIRAVTPIEVPEDELERRRQRYAQLQPEGIRIELHNLAGAPRQLDSEAAVRASERLVVAELLRTDPAAYDAVMADCVLDPGLEELERRAPVPAFGILKLCAGTLAAAGLRFGAVARNAAIAQELEARVRAHGHGAAFSGVTVLNLALEDIGDPARWNAALRRAAAAFEASGTRAVINGCSAVEVLPGAGGRVAVIDPTALALAALGLLHARGLLQPHAAGAAAR